jgi:hypothetical protein
VIFNNPLLFITFDLGFVTFLFGLLFALAWLEHPTTPAWWDRLRVRASRRHRASASQGFGQRIRRIPTQRQGDWPQVWDVRPSLATTPPSYDRTSRKRKEPEPTDISAST